MKTQKIAEKLKKEISKIFIGKEEQVNLVIMSTLSGGHILLDDLPGSGKTVLVKTISKALGSEYKRIQFTPDLLPSDVIGMTVYDRQTSAFKQIKGPVFTNILLADEINRAIPRTQAALLEAMEEQQVTIDNYSYALPQPFIVMATQNPVERESTFRLPAAQMDRFFIKISLGFLDRKEEMEMLTSLGDKVDFSVIEAVTNPQELIELKDEIQSVFVSDSIKEYIVELVHRTRENKLIESGASPRGSRGLYQGAKTAAAIAGRDYVTPEDIRKVYIPIMNHRILLTNEARFTKKTEAEILASILNETPVPPKKENYFSAN